ncbi:MAG: hypothetical protein EXS25_10470 [Pedosphaera sp.]|nr:hypothetical protein [Pedosphaera sp.]
MVASGAVVTPVLALVPNGTGLDLVFETAPNQSYTLRQRYDLIAGEWQTLRTIPAGNGGETIRIGVTPDSTSAFFQAISPAR